MHNIFLKIYICSSSLIYKYQIGIKKCMNTLIDYYYTQIFLKYLFVKTTDI